MPEGGLGLAEPFLWQFGRRRVLGRELIRLDAAQQLAEAGKPAIRWLGAEAPAPAYATASRCLQSLLPT